MRLALLSVRGSTPAPGAEFVRYGGHTSCVAALRDGEDTPALVPDAGTGLRGLGARLGGAVFSGSVLLSHLHWDHVQGLPFCPAVDHPASAVDLYLPTADSGVSPADLLARDMSPPHFPIGPDGAERQVAVSLIADRLRRHRGVRRDVRRDHAPRYDGQYFEPERATARATIDDAIQFAQRCGARRLVLTHHAPGRTDDVLDALARSCAYDGPLSVEVARQGDVLPVVGQRASTRRAARPATAARAAGNVKENARTPSAP